MSKDCFKGAVEAYASVGVDVNAALDKLATIPISLHCWQGDDVGGFEEAGAVLSGGGIQTTGNYPGKARSIAELRSDMDKVMELVPGAKRVSLHASYGEFGDKKVDRDAIEPRHFQGWVDWARERKIGLDFNGTYFSHPLAAAGYTLASKDPAIRAFWLEHGKRSRQISNWIGEQLGSTCVLDTWIPDGAKDTIVDKYGHRRILEQTLDDMFAVEYPAENMADALETKLFGIGSESFVVGSHEFYMGYALKNKKMLCIDMGHFHSDEDVSDKVSSLLLYFDKMLFHVSRPVRWDSDHVPLFNDKVKALMEEIVRMGRLDDVYIALDFFDASINRIGAWVTGARSTRKALLWALLEPRAALLSYEDKGDYYGRLALLEARNVLPFGAVWDEFCSRQGVPGDLAVISSVHAYEDTVLRGRM
ncbi:L-rhamnose isomerase [Parasphaerochaeta coccoides]|uniref:L-rhamnose isomerase n=1 Tax=Parasphaerochaeta coccoides (strain ATCC BAA-1237 / DSM 17374 / SPN1) TaxID=760011 RepID=F4GKH6_PARC1|nr:L-rhamnose isomerase [Parasphaerochaeta coccoides]AEC02859.1 L-rhamnose isomerase [Parasphaerochaeta coccoides DSM 17374]